MKAEEIKTKTISKAISLQDYAILAWYSFVSAKDTGETRTIFVWSDNEQIRSGNETDDITKNLFNSFLNNYQEEIILRIVSGFVFESVDLLSYFH